MRALITLFITVILFIFPIASFAATQKSGQDQTPENIQSDVRQLKRDIKTTASDVEILRRDQINYKIEKDLLKEAYSSNLQSINIIITIVFGVIGVLGYLGIRSIKEVKSDYTNELNELKIIKSNFEKELQVLVNKQKEFEGKIGEVTNTNEKQDRRLRVLELIEKAGGFMASKQWQWALEYISIGLAIDNDNVQLLSQKATCHGKLGEFSLAADACKKIIELESPSKTGAFVVNLLEFLALSNQQNEFAKIYASHKDKIDKEYDGSLIVYLNALLSLIKGDLVQAVKDLDVFAKKFAGDELRKYLGEGWSTEEVSCVVSKLPAGKQKELLEKVAQFFNGQISSNVFIKNLVL